MQFPNRKFAHKIESEVLVFCLCEGDSLFDSTRDVSLWHDAQDWTRLDHHCHRAVRREERVERFAWIVEDPVRKKGYIGLFHHVKLRPCMLAHYMHLKSSAQNNPTQP